MGSSVRSDLNEGFRKEWDESLREAARLIRNVIDDVSRESEGEGQFDNSVSDGNLIGRLEVAEEIIRGETPPVHAVGGTVTVNDARRWFKNLDPERAEVIAVKTFNDPEVTEAQYRAIALYYGDEIVEWKDGK